MTSPAEIGSLAASPGSAGTVQRLKEALAALKAARSPTPAAQAPPAAAPDVVDPASFARALDRSAAARAADAPAPAARPPVSPWEPREPAALARRPDGPLDLARWQPPAAEAPRPPAAARAPQPDRTSPTRVDVETLARDARNLMPLDVLQILKARHLGAQDVRPLDRAPTEREP